MITTFWEVWLQERRSSKLVKTNLPEDEARKLHAELKAKYPRVRGTYPYIVKRTVELSETPRGFDYTEFTDRNGQECSLQKSSIAGEDCIWLGRTGNRMHLTQDDVRNLLPYLEHFVNTGDLA